MAIRIIIDKTWDGHPCEPSEVARLTLSRSADGLTIHVDAPFHGDPRPAAPAGPVWELWNYEVVELFIVGVGHPEPYLEVELGPHGHHLVLKLRGIRHIEERELPLIYTTLIEGDRWTATAQLPTAYLPAGVAAADRITANAVAIHGPPAARRYLSARPLPGNMPDFHRIEQFPTLTWPTD